MMMNLWCFYVNESIQLNFQINSGEYYKLKCHIFYCKGDKFAVNFFFIVMKIGSFLVSLSV